jgi:hypothetical protein
MTLTAIGPDSCAAREEALAGPWVRADFPPPINPAATLPAGTHLTARFNPFGDEARPGALSLTVPGGWKVKEDLATSFLLHRLADAAQSPPITDTLVSLLAQPRKTTYFLEGSTCSVDDAPGVGPTVDDIVGAIEARAGVVSTPPVRVTIGGYDGQMLDLHLATSWTGGCLTPDGLKVLIPILQGSAPNAGPVVLIGPDQPLRLILLDLGDGRTLALSIYGFGPLPNSAVGEQLAEVMAVVESFEFHRPTP